MKEHGCRSATWKKKFCAVLIVSLFIEGICFQQRKVTLSAQAMPGDRAEADFSTPSNLKTELSDQGETKADDQKSKETNDNGAKVSESTSSYKVLTEEKQPEAKGLTCLQIPEKLKIIIDPWEIDEKGQIYSEPFTIKNGSSANGRI